MTCWWTICARNREDRARSGIIQALGEGKGETPTIGGTYAVELTDSANQPCEVLVVVLLQASEGKITHEALYYEPESFIKCGWVN